MQTTTPPSPPAIVAPASPTAFGSTEARRITLPSDLPTGDTAEDTIAIDYHPTATPNAPAIVILPPIGSKEGDATMRHMAEAAAAHGINAAIVTLPYHGSRWPKAEGGRPNPALHFLSGDAARSAQAFAQSASDVVTVVDWMSKQGVDTHRLGVVGISLGAIVAHLVMGRDDRLSAGVAMLGGGNLPDISRNSTAPFFLRLFHPAQRSGPNQTNADAERILSQVDPLTFANGNNPRKVLMIEAARDFVIPPRDATALWNALGRPPIRWIDSNHFALRLVPNHAFEASLEYFHSVWDAPTSEAAFHVPTPKLYVPTIQFGLLYQTHSSNSLGLVPDLTYQLTSLGTYSNHLPMVHADFGVTPRGPFLGVAATLNTYMDVGFASRISSRTEAPRPYVGLHLTF